MIFFNTKDLIIQEEFNEVINSYISKHNNCRVNLNEEEMILYILTEDKVIIKYELND